MCCLLVAVLGVLVHVLINQQTQDRARHTVLAERTAACPRTLPGTPLSATSW
ncbi:hypothetical protein ACFVZM_24860 [Streptomyces sioyaensis]|uniref:hypothetical protein n=1 Tax=Streptomyces sioyaensis TaxID=67364 RepID=UPI003692CF2C